MSHMFDTFSARPRTKGRRPYFRCTYWVARLIQTFLASVVLFKRQATLASVFPLGRENLTSIFVVAGCVRFPAALTRWMGPDRCRDLLFLYCERAQAEPHLTLPASLWRVAKTLASKKRRDARDKGMAITLSAV